MKLSMVGLTVVLGISVCGCLDMDQKKPWYPNLLNCPDGFRVSTITSISECPANRECTFVTDPDDATRVQYCVENVVDYSGGGGINCPAGFISVSSSEKSTCEVVDDADEIDDDALKDKTRFQCISGALEGRLCRKVTPEMSGSRVDIQANQRCTSEQANPGSDTLRVHLIDIGQGDSIWIQTPTGQNVLIDGGDGGAFGKTSAGPIVTDYLNSHGFSYGSTFDAVILTHPHSDHFGGFNNIFNPTNSEGYKLANYLDPMDLEQPKADVPTTYTQWLKKMQQHITDPTHIYMPAKDKFNAGDSLPAEFFGSEIETQYITSENTYTGDDANPASIIFKLTYKGVSFMFSGDAEAAQEQKAIATNVPLSVNFFKVCHHGSSTSSTKNFLDAMWNEIPADKRYALISSGRKEYSGTIIPDLNTISRLLTYIDVDHLYSTSAGDDNKEEWETYRDDNILVVVKPNGSYYACYNGTN